MKAQKQPALSTNDAEKRLPAGRKAMILAYVNEQHEVTVSALAEEFSVSQYTIRRDLDELDRDGLLIRTHGGAVSTIGPVQPDSAFDIRLRSHAAAKASIGARAAQLVKDNTAVLINSGTTALALSRSLSHKRDLTVVTNNLRLSAEIAPESVREVFVLGGMARLVSQATIGPVLLQTANRIEGLPITCDTAFIAVGAVSIDRGYTTSSPAEAAMMAEMMQCSKRVVVMADVTKFNSELFAQISPLDQADVLVTDEIPDEMLASALSDAGVEVLVAASQ